MSATDHWQSGMTPDMLVRRARFMAQIRVFMSEHGLLEVDTPLLSNAAPSERTLECIPAGRQGYLVPSPEHALKRLLAEGAGPLYQLGHVFRAGEIGRWHNPEFTMLEWYGVDEDMEDAIARLAVLLHHLGLPGMGRQRTYREVFIAAVDVDPLTADVAALSRRAEELGVRPGGTENNTDRAFWLDLLMATRVQPELGQAGPEIVTHFPADDAVLVASDPGDSRQALRFECFWKGVELANGASELTDATLARHRMQREQAARAAQGSAVPPMDENLLAAMKAGLPRCAGVALGVDRLLALEAGHDGIAPVLPFAMVMARRMNDLLH